MSGDAGVEPRTAAALALMVRRLAIWLDLPILSAALSEDSKASTIFVHGDWRTVQNTSDSLYMIRLVWRITPALTER